MLDWLRRLLTKESRTTSVLTETAAGAPVLTQRNYQDLAKAGYQTNPYAFAAVQEVARGVGGLPWVAREKQRDGTLEPIDRPDHQAVQLLRRPNPGQSWPRLIETGVSNYYISGDLFFERTSPMLELYALRPDRVEILPGQRQEMVAGYNYSLGGNTVRFEPEEILHIKTYNPLDDWRGMSLFEACAVSIDQNNASRKWNTSLVQNQGKMGLALVTEGEISDKEWARLERLEAVKYAGAGNAGKTRIFEGGLKPMPITHSPAEMDWLEGLRHTGLEIAIVLNVPPELLGDSSHKTYSNYQEARKALLIETVLPLGDMIAADLTAWLSPVLGDNVEIGIDRDGIQILQEDRNQVWSRAIQAKDSGVITPEEAREEIGREPSDEDGADKLQVRIGTGFLEDLAAEDDEDPPPDSSEDADADAPPDPTDTTDSDDTAGKSANDPGRAKAFDLYPEARRQHWKTIDAKRERTLRAVERLVRKRFRAEKRMLQGKMRNALTPEQAADRALSSLERESEHWKTLFDAIYLEIGRPFAEDVIGAVKAQCAVLQRKQGEDAPPPPVLDTTMDIWTTRVLVWLENNSGRKINGINQTTLKVLRKHLAEGVALGESIDKLAKRIDSLYLDDIIPNRSKTIARTEVIAASNLGSQEAAKATGLPLKKVWLSTGDSRTREAHVDQDGEIEDMDKPWDIFGEKLMFPGDTSLGASAGQTINCRCSETYEVDREGGA